MMKFFFVGAVAASFLSVVGCGGGGAASTTTPTPTQTTGTVNMIVSDDPTQDWATIGVKVLSIALVPSGGGSNVTIYTAPSTPPMINLVQLDQLGEIIGNATVDTGTYSQAILTLSANNDGTNCDVSLIASADPETGFDVPAGTAVPCSQIVINHAQGSSGSMTVPLTVNLKTPLTVTTSGSNALDLEFNLADPALIVDHDPASGTEFWTVNFNGPVRHHPRADLTKLFLRDIYGQETGVSTDNTSITIDKAYPVHPITDPETAYVDTNAPLTILADATNGTLFYDLDKSITPTTITDFSSVASELPSMYLRVIARYQQNGTLVAARIYAASEFNSVWKSPEGHVLHVNTTTNVMRVATEDGKATKIAIGPNTNFYFRSSNTVIGTGTSFFDGTVTTNGLPNLARGFKVNATIDPLATATPPVAVSVDIEVARYDGTISDSTTTDFTYTRKFPMADASCAAGCNDNYSGPITYATDPTVDQEGNADANGFYYWNLGLPTLEDVSSSAVSDFVSATGGSVNFGGVVGALKPTGLSNAIWGDTAAPDSWSAIWTLLTPVPAPLGIDTTSCTWVTNELSPGSSTTGSFTFTVPLPSAAPSSTSPALPVTVSLNANSGEATLVYQVSRQVNQGATTITITPVDITTTAGQTTVSNALVTNITPVKVFGVPQSDGSIKAYELFYYTGTVSTK